MIGLLLAIIYISFISLGLPDSLLGSVWPSIFEQMGSTVSGAGNIAMVIAACTIAASLLADRLIHRFGTGKIAVVSVALTATALFGFSFCTRYWQLLLCAVPYGLGAGAIDSALNNYVALHFKARHMSWLHCMWGVGASVGPYIMGLCLGADGGWRAGYRVIGVIQLIITVLLLCAIPLWKGSAADDGKRGKVLSLRQAAALPGAKALFVTFFCYCALEASVGLWASSWMNAVKGVSAANAAFYAVLFFGGITLGRFISGFLSERMGDQRMIRLGIGLIFGGIALLLLPFGQIVAAAGLLVIGLGCAPIYPSIIHATPSRFGAEYAQSLVGVEMACAYLGTTFMPKLVGVLCDWIGIAFFPCFLLAVAGLMLFMSECSIGRAKRG